MDLFNFEMPEEEDEIAKANLILPINPEQQIAEIA